jgi:hypothetical protein
MTEKKKGEIAPENVQNALKSMIASEGTYKTSQNLGISRESVVRLAGGFPVRVHTLVYVQVKLNLLPKKSIHNE